MKRWVVGFILLLTTVLLNGCLYQACRKPAADVTCETWQRRIDTAPMGWMRGASAWFVEGVSKTVDEMNRSAPPTAAMSTMKVKVPAGMVNIKVKGKFQVQIFGGNDCNSLYLYGPNSAVRKVNVRVTDNTLYLEQAEDAPCNMDCVIIRVGIRCLQSLSQMGGGRIEGRMIRSPCLCITSTGTGNIYLSGTFNVANIASTNCGNISLFGAVTPSLNIKTSGSGSVNVIGNVGIHRLTHHGSGNVNIIGANSDGLCLYADGRGKIGINGQVAVKQINARDRVCVYIYNVNSTNTRVYLTDYAKVGLAGCACNLAVDAGGVSNFEGRHLYTANAYVRAHDAAHINVTGASKVFASAAGTSSVYFYGSPNVLTRFNRDYGVVMPIAGCASPKLFSGYCPYYPQVRYKDQV